MNDIAVTSPACWPQLDHLHIGLFQPRRLIQWVAGCDSQSGTGHLRSGQRGDGSSAHRHAVRLLQGKLLTPPVVHPTHTATTTAG